MSYVESLRRYPFISTPDLEEAEFMISNSLAKARILSATDKKQFFPLASHTHPFLLVLVQAHKLFHTALLIDEALGVD